MIWEVLETRRACGSLLGVSWGISGAFWSLFGTSWSPLGASWGVLGASREGPKVTQKSIRNRSRNRSESGRPKVAPELRFSRFLQNSSKNLSEIEAEIDSNLDGPKWLRSYVFQCFCKIHKEKIDPKLKPKSTRIWTAQSGSGAMFFDVFSIDQPQRDLSNISRKSDLSGFPRD